MIKDDVNNECGTIINNIIPAETCIFQMTLIFATKKACKKACEIASTD